MADDTPYEAPFTPETITPTEQTPNAVPVSGLPDHGVPEPNTQTFNPSPLTTMASARDEGYDWPAIDGHLANFRDRAAQFGYTDSEVDAHLGYQDRSATFDHLAANWQNALADDPAIPDKLLSTSEKFDSGTIHNGTIGDAYVTALVNGQVKGPDDFADMAARSLFHAMDVNQPGGTYDMTKATIMANLDQYQQQLRATLPDPKDLVDTSLAVANEAGLDVTPQNMALIQRNLMDHWSDTGEHPSAALTRAMADPQLREILTGDPAYKFPDIVSPINRIVQAAYLSGKSQLSTVPQDIAEGFAEYNNLGNKIYATDGNIVSHGAYMAALTGVALAGGSLQTIQKLFNTTFLPPIAAGLQLVSEVAPPTAGRNEPFESAMQAPDVLNQLAMIAPATHVAGLGFVQPGTSLKASVLQSEALRTAPAAVADIATQLVSNARSLMQDQFPKGMKAPWMVSLGEDTSFKQAEPHDIAPQPPITYSVTSEKTGQTAKIDSTAGQAPTTMPNVDVIEHHRVTITDINGDKTGFLVDMDGPTAKIVNLPKMRIADLQEVAQHLFSQNPDIETVEGRSRQGAVSLPREQIMHQPDAAMEAMGASPHEVVTAMVNRALGQPATDAAFDAGVNKLRQGTPGQWFSDLVPNASPATKALAKGYDTAATMMGMFRQILSDESGAGKVVKANPQSEIYQSTYMKMDRFLNALNGNPARDAAVDLIRNKYGVSDQVMRYHANQLDGAFKSVNNTIFKSSLRDNFEKAVRAGDLDQDPLFQVLKYAEGRGPVMLDPKEPTTPLAYAARAALDDLKAQLDQIGPQAYKDYLGTQLRYMFQRPELADTAFLGKALTKVPTFTEALEKGLMPREEFMDPTRAIMGQVRGMARYKASHDVIAEGKNTIIGFNNTSGTPLIQDFERGSQIPIGYKQLVNRPGTYGLDGFANVWNRFANKGRFDNDRSGLYTGWMHFSNTLTALKLAFPLYHAQAMLTEAMMANISTGLGRIAQREFAKGLTDVGAGLIAPWGVARLISEGRKLQANYLAKNMAGDPVATAFAQARGRVAGRQDVYKPAKGPSLLQAWEQGGIRGILSDLTHDLVQTVGQPDESATVRASLFGPRLVGFGAREAIRTMQLATGSDFLFDKFIPWVKQGAFAQEMQMHIDRNPTSSQEAIRVKARQIVDSMDNRFGELNQDNLFWNNTLKQGLNASLVSLGWEYGSLRAFANSVGIGMESGHQLQWNPVAFRWLLSFAIGSTLVNNVYQYGMTGKSAWQTGDIWDNFIPRTGGINVDKHSGIQAPARAMLPGYMKDAFNFLKLWMARPVHDPFGPAQVLGSEIMGKANPAIQLAEQVFSGKDYFGNPIASKPVVGADGKLHRGSSFLDAVENYRKVFLEALKPIGITNMEKDTGLPWWQTLAGINKAPNWAVNPKGFRATQEYFYNKTAGTQLGSANRAAGNVAPVKQTRASRMKAINRMNE